jgi:NAD(P)-dependent dehydrogenase (short-subunit alcohol dehydrogenase family)
MSDKRLDGKVAWVSGAATGIGKATALLFAQEGAAVTLAGLSHQKAQMAQIVQEIESHGGRALAVECDVTIEDDVRRSIEETTEQFGGLDIVINNAGIVEVKMLHEYKEENYDRVMDTNVKSMFFSFKYAYEHLVKNPHSVIVNVGSISTFVGQAGTPIYTTSKHAILGLTRSMALDYANKGIRCNCICPGITDTPMLRAHLQTEEAITERLQRSPVAEMVMSPQVARSILYLSCDDSAGITGTSLVIDNGYLACAEWDSAKHL